LKFPRHGDDHNGCDWITLLAQGVPAHVGTSSPGPESEPEDPYSAFLPPASTAPTDDDDQTMRAVVFNGFDPKRVKFDDPARRYKLAFETPRAAAPRGHRTTRSSRRRSRRNTR
jgi:hypothetical protein